MGRSIIEYDKGVKELDKIPVWTPGSKDKREGWSSLPSRRPWPESGKLGRGSQGDKQEGSKVEEAVSTPWRGKM